MGWTTAEEAAQFYADRVANYQLGLDWMPPGTGPVILSDKQKTKIRQHVYKWLRTEYPNRFPKGYRFN